MVTMEDPLLTDIFSMISEKLEESETIRELLGEGNNLRIFRSQPHKSTIYPVLSMQLISMVGRELDYLYRDYTVRLTVWDKTSDRSNQDRIIREVLSTFSNPDINYSKNNTRVEFVTPVFGFGEFFDVVNRLHMTYESLRIRARRNITIN